MLGSIPAGEPVLVLHLSWQMHELHQGCACSADAPPAAALLAGLPAKHKSSMQLHMCYGGVSGEKVSEFLEAFCTKRIALLVLHVKLPARMIQMIVGHCIDTSLLPWFCSTHH